MMFDVLLVIGLVVSAFFAIHFDEAIYAVLSLAIMNIILSIFYFSLGTFFAAVFQLAMGIGTVAVLFLAGEMLTKGVDVAQTFKQRILGLVIGILLSIPSILAVGRKIAVASSFSVQFSTALWELRAIDVIAQGLVILTVALGIALVLKEKRRGT
jgi:NADH:ubiquinone oxidoreductase subunit 6 (subunit J)